MHACVSRIRSTGTWTSTGRHQWKWRSALALALSFMALPHIAASGEAPNVLVNGSFEAWNGKEPTGWTVLVDTTEGEGPVSILGPGADRGPGAHGLVLAGADTTRQWLAVTQSIPVVPGDVFRFAGWLRSAGVEAGAHRYRNAQVALFAKGPQGRRINAWVLGPVTGTTDWERREVCLQAPLGSSTLDVSVLLSINGTFGCDDLVLEKVDLPKAEPGASREGRWSADIAFLGELLPMLHVSPFTKIDDGQWRAGVADLKAQADALSDDQLHMRLMALVALIGDAHSGIAFPERAGKLPVGLWFFGDDLRVLAVDRRCAELAGGRVVRIGSKGIADCLAALRPLVACETESWFRQQAPGLLVSGDMTRCLGLADSTGAVEMTVVAESGREVTCRVSLPDSGQAVDFEVREPAREARPLCQSMSAGYWFKYLPAERTFYLQYNRCREDARRPIAAFTREVTAALDSLAIDRFVLDVRYNAGGESGLLAGLVKEVAARRAAGRIGRCFVITGRATFSSGVLDALDFRRATGALVAGEPMGGKPNHFGQLNSFTLPNSGLKVWYSTRKFVRVPGDPPILAPDLPVESTWDDYLAGRDPVLERILAEK